MAVGTGAYGTNASNAVSYGQGGVSAGATILSSTWTTLETNVNAERTRRGSGAATFSGAVTVGSTIAAVTFNSIKTQLEVAGPAASSAYNGAWQNYNSSNGVYLSGYTTGIVGYDSYYGAAVYGPVAVYSASPTPETVTYPQAAAPTGSTAVAVGNLITAAGLNALITECNNAGAVCTCNCNYCTCNCNYCTCNCNYACTCNCNYSDERVKTNIEYM